MKKPLEIFERGLGPFAIEEIMHVNWQAFLIPVVVINDNKPPYIYALFFVACFSLCTPFAIQARENSQFIATEKGGHSRSATLTAERLRLGLVVGHAGIDPDTGLHDPGFRCPDGLTEVEVNRTIARVAAGGLENLGFHVDLLDEFDERLQGYKAAALISIHTDNCATGDTNATGYKAVGTITKGDPAHTQQLVDCLVERYGLTTELPYRAGSIYHAMTDFHSFSEIDERTPAVIFEAGSLSLDREFVTQQADNAARGIIDGILCYVYHQPVIGEDFYH